MRKSTRVGNVRPHFEKDRIDMAKEPPKSGTKATRKPKKPVLPKKTKTDEEIQLDEIDELAEAFVESLAGREPNVSMNALASAVATMCVTTDVTTDRFLAIAKAHVEENARRLYKKKRR